MALLIVSISLFHVMAHSDDKQSEKVFPGADAGTPSRSEYFTWLNHRWEGPTQEQSLANLRFFKWLHDTYGMQLDIYALDAGTMDSLNYYGSLDSKRFKNLFPDGFEPLVKEATSMDTRLGLWCGPDGFGNTEESAKKRIDLMVGICRDCNLALFKFDACCGQLRPEKEKYFIEMMRKSRKHSPDLIALNHRLKLSPNAKRYVTTFLMGGKETYVDVHMANRITCPHHREKHLERSLPRGLERLTEDHGVCFNSALDAWDDDLILQAFNRCMILAPEIYGNVWDLRDSEFPKLAWIFNLHRRYRKILVNGKRLPQSYGPNAVSRGDDTTRLITLRNLSWHPKTISINLSEEIGLKQSDEIYVLRYHPTERFIGIFQYNDKVDVEVPQFRSELLLVTSRKPDFLTIKGAPYQVVKDVKGEPLELRLFGMPGTKTEIEAVTRPERFSKVTLDGKPIDGLLQGKKVSIDFPGEPLKEPYHRELAQLKECAFPADAEALYESTAFAGDNNALETDNLLRSGSTAIPQVQAARDAFFKQPLFIKSGAWDRFMFDGQESTYFAPNKRFFVNGGALRVDFGSPLSADRIELKCTQILPKNPPPAEISVDLQTWTPLEMTGGKTISIAIPKDVKFRYLRIKGFHRSVSEVNAYTNGTALDRKSWRGSNLFSPFEKLKFKKAWTGKIHIKEASPGSYLCVAVNGRHGREGAYATLKVSGTDHYIGAPDRAPTYPTNPWEYRVATTVGNTTYYFPVTKEMLDKEIDVYVLGVEAAKLTPCVWLTRHTPPYAEKTLILK